MNDAIYSVLDIAEYCLYYCTSKSKAISNLQLQKILYYIQAAFLVEKNRPCFQEKVVSWRYGPVVEEAYQVYRYNLSDTIYLNEKPNIFIHEDDKRLIEKVCNAKSKYSALSLVTLTHGEEPWMKTKQSEAINLVLIKKYFNANKEKIYN